MKSLQLGLRNSLVKVFLLGTALALTSEGGAERLQDRRPLRRLEDIKHIIIIYQENWSFDALYGRFPCANGYANGFDTLPQFDVRAEPPYSALIYQTPSPLRGLPLAPDPNFPSVGGKLALASDHSLAVPADLVAAVQKSEIWNDCVIIITYDENGGRWDHVVPPMRGDGWGAGTRVPAIIVSPFVKSGGIDSTEYETVSILKLIERRFHLSPLAPRDKDPKINDLTHALGYDDIDTAGGPQGCP
jgi:phospholipase C